MHLPYIEAPMPLNSQDNKMPSARNRLPLLELLASEEPQTPHPTLQVTVNALGYPSTFTLRPYC